MEGKKLLYEKLSYELRGVAMSVRNNYGPGCKEKIYANAFAEELSMRKIIFEREKHIGIYSCNTGKLLGSYRADFLIDDKIIIEMKAVDVIPKNFLDQLYSYLRNSKYQLGFLINFKSPKLYIKRIIHTNDRKKFLFR